MKKQIELTESGVAFDASRHEYWLGDRKLQGITTTLVHYAYPDTYEGIDPDTLQHAAERGTMLHKAVGDYYTKGFMSPGADEIVAKAEELLSAKKLTPQRFEYIVTDGEHFASPIDIVCTDDKGKVALVDMKFTYQLHYDEVTMQTSIYKSFFELQNEGLVVDKLYCLWISTGDDLHVGKAKLEELSPQPPAVIEDLKDAYLSQSAFSMAKYYGDFPATLKGAEEAMRQLDAEIKQRQSMYTEIKDGLLELMERYNIKSYADANLTITRVLGAQRTAIDSKALKQDMPDVWKAYSRTTKTKPSLKITYKEL